MRYRNHETWDNLIHTKGSTDINLILDQLRNCSINAQGTAVYFIEEDNKDLGFCAMYRAWLEYIYLADVCGMIPVVQAGNHFAYKEDGMINGTRNAFEYYFLQPTSIGIREAGKKKNILRSCVFHRGMVELVLTGKYAHYEYTKRYMHEMARIVRKYINFNEQTQQYVAAGIKKLGIEDTKVLGVHIRGTDFRAKYDNHPIYVTEDDCFQEVNKLMQEKGYEKIFVATDDMRILKNFCIEYGNKMCFYEDVERSNKNRSVAFSKSSRKQHRYLLGLEVIRDMYTLSKCVGLVAGISQVAICAQMHKLADRRHYEDIKIIDKGIYQNSHSFIRF
jgi:CBS domain-containing protein